MIFINKRLRSIFCLMFFTISHCYGQLDQKTAADIQAPSSKDPLMPSFKATTLKPPFPQGITKRYLPQRTAKSSNSSSSDFQLNSQGKLLNPLDYPALGATEITFGNSQPMRFFIDEFNKTVDTTKKLDLIFRAPRLLSLQFEVSKNPIIKGNPWYLYKGLEEFKQLRKQYPHDPAKKEILHKLFSQTFSKILAHIPTIKIEEQDFWQLWINATTPDQRDQLLAKITDVIVNSKLAAAAHELVGFIGVLSREFSYKQVNASLQKLLDNDLADLATKSDDTYLDLILKVSTDLETGPNAKTIAEMAIRDRVYPRPVAPTSTTIQTKPFPPSQQPKQNPACPMPIIKPITVYKKSI